LDYASTPLDANTLLWDVRPLRHVERNDHFILSFFLSIIPKSDGEMR